MNRDVLPQQSEPPRLQREALATILPLGLAAGAVAFAIAAWSGAPSPMLSAGLALAFVLAGGGAILAGLKAGLFPHDRLGLANRVTMTRGAMIAALAGLIPAAAVLGDPPGVGWAVFALALVAALLDGVDGWAARRSGLQSDFGARLDMETDVALALVLGLLAWTTGKVGIWFLTLGLMRPAFVLAGMLLPALRLPLPEARRRKVVAAVQMGVQVALIAPVIAPPVSHLVGAAGLALVALSFAIDIRWQFRHARSAA
jgi:phosphatidylglycerophosphate synthase